MLTCRLPPSLLVTYTVCLCHLWDVRPYGSSLFLLSGLFVEVLPSSALRMVPSILQRRQSRCLSFWWGFCDIVWFHVVFSFSWDTLLIFFFHLRLFNGVRFQYSKALVSFLSSERSDFFLIWQFCSFPSFVVFRFSLLAWYIFLCHIPSLYRHYIPSLPVLGFPILFHFWQTVWCRPCTFRDWSYLAI